MWPLSVTAVLLLGLAIASSAEDLTCSGLLSSSSRYSDAGPPQVSSGASSWCCWDEGNATDGARGLSLPGADFADNGPCHTSGLGASGLDGSGKKLDVYTSCSVSSLSHLVEAGERGRGFLCGYSLPTTDGQGRRQRQLPRVPDDSQPNLSPPWKPWCCGITLAASCWCCSITPAGFPAMLPACLCLTAICAGCLLPTPRRSGRPPSMPLLVCLALAGLWGMARRLNHHTDSLIACPPACCLPLLPSQFL